MIEILKVTNKCNLLVKKGKSRKSWIEETRKSMNAKNPNEGPDGIKQ